MDFDDFGEINFDSFEFDEVGEGDFPPIPDFGELPEFEDVQFDPFTDDIFPVMDDMNPNPFEADDRLRYADESPPTGNRDLRGPFRSLERAEAYTSNFAGGLEIEYIYDGEYDHWYVEIGGSL